MLHIKSPIGWIELQTTETHLIHGAGLPNHPPKRRVSKSDSTETIWQLEEYFEETDLF